MGLSTVRGRESNKSQRAHAGNRDLRVCKVIDHVTEQQQDPAQARLLNPGFFSPIRLFLSPPLLPAAHTEKQASSLNHHTLLHPLPPTAALRGGAEMLMRAVVMWKHGAC